MVSFEAIVRRRRRPGTALSRRGDGCRILFGLNLDLSGSLHAGRVLILGTRPADDDLLFLGGTLHVQDDDTLQQDVVEGALAFVSGGGAFRTDTPGPPQHRSFLPTASGGVSRASLVKDRELDRMYQEALRTYDSNRAAALWKKLERRTVIDTFREAS